VNILPKIFYGLALLFIPLAIILDQIGGVPQPRSRRRLSSCRECSVNSGRLVATLGSQKQMMSQN
jgi:hypothetical protein